MTGSRGIPSPSSLEVSSNPLKKDATTSPSSSGSSRSEPLAVAPSSPDPDFGPEGQLGVGGLQTAPGGTSSSAPPYYVPSGPCSWISPSLPGGFQVQLSLSSFSSRVAAVASIY